MKSEKIAKIIGIIYIVFISIFAFDTKLFSIEFLIHLIPSIIFICCLITAYFKPKIGGILFIIAGIITIFFFKTYQEIISAITISLVPMIIGYLFLKRK
jgi:hypothetical protein